MEEHTMNIGQTTTLKLLYLLNKYNDGKKIIVYGDAITHPSAKRCIDSMSAEARIGFQELISGLCFANLLEKRPLEEYVALFCARDDEDIPA